MGSYIRALRAPSLQRLVTVEAPDGARSDVVCGAVSFLRRSGWQTTKIQKAQEAVAKAKWNGVRMVEAVILTDTDDKRRILPDGHAMVWPDRKDGGMPLIISDGMLETARVIGRVIAVRGFVPSWAIGHAAACDACVTRRWRDGLRAIVATRWPHLDPNLIDAMARPANIGNGTQELAEALKQGLVNRYGIEGSHYTAETATSIILARQSIAEDRIDWLLDQCATSAHTRMGMRRHIEAGLTAIRKGATDDGR